MADLGDHAFLDLWSYPNLFYEKKKGGKGDGKEMCDILVVCGDDIIIFSDKAIKWQDDRPLEVAWPRFYRNAIEEAVKQINGAANWIDRFPARIFTDPACTQKLPIELPPMDTRRMHGVVIATGAQLAIKQHYNDDSGSFPIVPHFKGRDAIDFSQPNFFPFGIGDVNPDGMFVHVFDDLSIRRVIEHLDTITDFTQYLNERARYLRTDRLALAYGEEELLALYLNSTMRNNGVPTFELPRPKKLDDYVRITAQGEWRAYLRSDAYFTKKMADEVSYLWDKLIKLFTENTPRVYPTLSGCATSRCGGGANVSGILYYSLWYLIVRRRFLTISARPEKEHDQWMIDHSARRCPTARRLTSARGLRAAE